MWATVVENLKGGYDGKEKLPVMRETTPFPPKRAIQFRTDESSFYYRQLDRRGGEGVLGGKT